jgi:hypothetical protein
MISRMNGLKHGLTGAGIVIPDEDVKAVEERFEAFEADLKPKNDAASFMTRRAAFLSVRLERCALQEAAKITRDMTEAEDKEADARAEELIALIDSITEQPVIAVRKLQRSSEGIDWLLESWRSMKVSLLDRTCDRWNPERAQRLCGRVPRMHDESRIWVLTRALYGQFEGLSSDDWADLPDLERREAARVALAAIIDVEVARLGEVRKGLDHEAIAKDRSGASARAMFDASKEAVLARKYEAAAERGFYKALKAIEQINATVEESKELDSNEPAAKDCDELASCFPARGVVSERSATNQELNRQDARSNERGYPKEEREGGKSPLYSPAPLGAPR